jgi:tight adherence protein C
MRDNRAFELIEPAMRFISQRVYGLMSPGLRARLDRQIMVAGDLAGLQPEDVLSLTLMSGVFGTALGVLYGSGDGGGGDMIVFGVVLGLAGLALPHLYLSSAADQRVRSIAGATPPMIDLLALCLGAGLDFPAAVRQVVDRARLSEDPLQEELRLLLQELNIGRTRRKALEQMAERAPCDPVRDLVGAVVQSEEQGTPLSDVLRVQAATSRMHRSTRAEETAAKAAAKMMLPLALLFVSVLALITGPIILSFMAQFSSS